MSRAPVLMGAREAGDDEPLSGVAGQSSETGKRGDGRAMSMILSVRGCLVSNGSGMAGIAC